MAINKIPAGNVRSCRNSFHSCRWVALLALWYFSGCSLQGFDYLTKGGASGIGGSDQSGGGTRGNPQGGAASTGGANAGGANAGGANAGGTLAGGANTGGIASGGTVSSTNVPGDGGPDDLSGCAFTQTGGRLLTPPSQGFETDISTWTTTAAHTTALSRVAGNGENCEGKWYMSCDGSQRTAYWDGPVIEVAPYLTIGHIYQVSVAIRQSPVGYAGTPISMKLVDSRACGATVYDPDLINKNVSSSWTRLTGQFTLAAPSGCTTVTSVKIYIASTAEAGPTYVSFDVDDFKLIDLSAS